MDGWMDRHDIANFCFSQFYSATKICSAGAELFRADGWMGGQTDMTKLTAAFAKFYEHA
jgi:hypothetical protein